MLPYDASVWQQVTKQQVAELMVEVAGQPPEVRRHTISQNTKHFTCSTYTTQIP